MNPVVFFPAAWLNALAWAALLAVPPAIIALYFLKLRRRPLVVPSTLLWRRAVEDLHVNSLWQRLRRNLLLLLQLLAALAILTACMRPGWNTAELAGNRLILLVDTSASMQATDVAPSRLERAKAEAMEWINAMGPGDVAMVVAASNEGRVAQPFTDNRRALRDAVRRLRPTERTTDVQAALRYAASLANPSRSGDQPAGLAAPEGLPATLVLLTDGGFDAVPEFSLGNLTPVYRPLGSPAAANAAVVAFQAERNPQRPSQVQAFARLANFGPADAVVEAALYVDDRLLDVKRAAIPSGDEAGLVFDLPDLESAALRLELSPEDHLPLDNTAYAALNRPRRARVLLATPGNRYLELALATDEAEKLAEVAVAAPEDLRGTAYRQAADRGAYDLIIFDRCAPPAPPQANTLYLGSLPPAPAAGPGAGAEDAPARAWRAGPPHGPPLITDVVRVHPLMQFVDLSNVHVLAARPLDPPSGAVVLVDSDIGPLLALAPRGGYQDAVLGFAVTGPGAADQVQPNTDWPRRRSFPLFLMNALAYLGGVGLSAAAPSVRPGQPAVLPAPPEVRVLEIAAPDGRRRTIQRQGGAGFVWRDTERQGLYEAYAPGQSAPLFRFAVNLFDRRESDLKPRDQVELGYTTVAGRQSRRTGRRELWKWLLAAALAVLAFEWYVYNRRVYF